MTIAIGYSVLYFCLSTNSHLVLESLKKKKEYLSFNCTIASHHAFFKKSKQKPQKNKSKTNQRKINPKPQKFLEFGMWNLVFLINILNVFKYLSTCNIPCVGVLRYFLPFVTLKDSVWVRVSSPMMYRVLVRNAFGAWWCYSLGLCNNCSASVVTHRNFLFSPENAGMNW